MHNLSLTLVVPCFNEEARLDAKAFVEWVCARASRHLLFVDDASTDQTAGLLEGLQGEYPQISVLHLTRNLGKAGAVRAGMLGAPPSDLVGFWDADLATPLKEVNRLADVLANNLALKCAAGIRVMRLGARIERSFARHVLSRLFITIASSVLKLHAYDTQCGAKLFRRDIVKPLFAEDFVSAWLFDVELYLRLRKLVPDTELTECVSEQVLNEWRAVGQSKLPAGAFVWAPLELYRIYRRYR